MTQPEPLELLTIPEVARMLHVSGDTVRRQIREGDLPAVRIGVTPSGRPRYRVSSQAVQLRLGQLPAPDPIGPLRAIFAELTSEEREELLTQAIAWARAKRPDVGPGGLFPHPPESELRARFLRRRQRFEK